jgi:hypothetical protein
MYKRTVLNTAWQKLATPGPVFGEKVKDKMCRKSKAPASQGRLWVSAGADELSAHSSNYPKRTNARACKGQRVNWRWACQHPDSNGS